MSLADDVKKDINLFIIQVDHEGTNLGEKRLSLWFFNINFVTCSHLTTSKFVNVFKPVTRTTINSCDIISKH